MSKSTKSANLVKMNASAGSGKTHTLTTRFVNLLFDSDIAPCESCKPVKNKAQFNFSELLAITFTNLAANQMKEKVIAKLKQYALKELSLEEAGCKTQEELEEKSLQARAILERIFQQYGALNIRTIDSLLNQIIGLFALELGYSPHFETSFGSEDFIEELYVKLAEQSIEHENSCDANAINYAPYFHELCKNKFENSEHASFLAKSSLFEQVAKFVSYFIKNNEIVSAEEFEALKQNYAFLKQKNAELPQKLCETVQNIKTCIEEQNITLHKGFIKALQENNFSSAYLKKESFAGVLLKNNTGDITKASEYYQELQDIIQKIRLVEPVYKNYALMLPAIKISAELSLRLNAYERQKQCINTQKMPHIIARLLGEEDSIHNAFLAQKKQEEQLVPAAYCRLGTRIKHILYDEFQDTSVAQWNALKDLSSESLASGGSVFFVGDVKQAIYGWRGGKASLFSDAPKELKFLARGFSDDNLPCNWRSAENIVAWNNTFFRNLAQLNAEHIHPEIALLFPSSADENFPADLLERTSRSLCKDYEHVELQIDEKRLKKAGKKGVVEVHTLKEADALFDVAVLSLLPEMVQNLSEKYGGYSKIAILTVNNSQASLVSQILLERSIPVVSQGSLGLKEHPVIIEVISFLRFLENPLDESALCQVLLSRHILPKSFSENCPAEELFDFFANSRKEFLFTAFREKYPDLWRKYFQVLVDGANLLTAYDTLCEIYNRMGIMERNPEAAVYLLRLKELAYLTEEKGIVDLHAFLSWWEKNGEKENAPLPESLNSVSVLTMHKSKGLEYEAVIIPWHNFKIDVQDEISQFDVSFEEKSYPVYAKLDRKYGAPYYEAIAEKVKECINLLYVAWTRPKQELHIFIPEAYSSKKNGLFYRFLKAFLERAKEDLKQLAFEENADCLHFGENCRSAVSEKMLRILEYVFELTDEKEKKNTQKLLTKNEREQLAAFFEEYREEKTPKKKHENDEEQNEQETAPAVEVKILSDDVLFVAKRLLDILSSQKEKQHVSAPETSRPQQEEDYSQEHSMDWLPQLRIFRSDLDELTGAKGLSSNKRGTIIHKSLEYLVFSGDVVEDCRRASFEAMKYLPYGRFLGQSTQEASGLQNSEQKDLYEQVQKSLQWFASLAEPFGGADFWFKYGYKEHSITNEMGELFRVDLMVEIPEKLRKKYQDIAYIAVDYKTGYVGEKLPVPDNKKQILNYIDLLTKATGKKSVGLLVYLDNEQCCLVESE